MQESHEIMVEKKIVRQQILPIEKAPFTVKNLKDAIPEHCFKRDTVTSFVVLFKDLTVFVITLVAAIFIDKLLCGTLSGFILTMSRFLFWIAYTVYQGINMTALWVLAHECGHESFVESKFINDLVGFLLHTPLIVPYFSWQKSHALHHHFTNNMQKDQVWVPTVFDKNNDVVSRKSSIQNAIDLVLMSTIGWPAYILVNATGPKTKSFVSHFWAGSEIFTDKEIWKVNVSGLGLLIWCYILYRIIVAWGLGFVARVYGAPLIVQFFFLTSITFLQHTDDVVPHYDDSEWSWLRGALCTVDRPISEWMDHKLHYIHSHHVIHHLFSKLPSYHAPEATEAIKKVCGSYYLKDDTNYFVALWNNYRDCVYLEPDSKISTIYWWKNMTALPNKDLRSKKES